MKIILVFFIASALTVLSISAVQAGNTEAANGDDPMELLRNKAEAEGIVRVIVTIAQPDGSADNTSSIESAKLLMQNALPMDDAPFVDPIEGQPLVVMEVSPRGLDWLAQAPMVQKIELDGVTGIPPVIDDANGDPERNGTVDDDEPSFGGGGSNDLSAPQSN